MKTKALKITLPFLLVFLTYAFIQKGNTRNYLFIALHPIPACDGKCNNFSVEEYQRKTAEDCKKLEDSCKIKYKDKTTYYTITPAEGAIFYKYNKFVQYCDCKIQGIHKAASVELAKEEMNKKVDSARAKNPKAYHNYEVYKTWP